MDEFEIEVSQTLYTLKPQEDGSFIVYQNEHLLGTIAPHIADDTFVSWTTLDLISAELVREIGRLIEDKEM